MNIFNRIKKLFKKNNTIASKDDCVILRFQRGFIAEKTVFSESEAIEFCLRQNYKAYTSLKGFIIQDYKVWIGSAKDVSLRNYGKDYTNIPVYTYLQISH